MICELLSKIFREVMENVGVWGRVLMFGVAGIRPR